MKPVRAALLLAFLVALAPWPAGAQRNGQDGKVGAWFDQASHQGYAEAQSQVEKAADQAAQAGVPEDLLVERLDEGAAKQVAAPVLERALQEDAARLAALAGLFDRTLPKLTQDERTDALREGGIAMRAGMDIATIERAIGWTVDTGQEPRRVMAALAAVASLQRPLDLGPDDELSMARALARSREAPPRYGSFVSLLASARARGLDSRSLVATTIAVLSRAGTFLAVQQELDRKLRR